MMSDTSTKPTVLVMDDDDDVRFIAELMLNRLGFAAVLTASGAETVECYKTALEAGGCFHAVILDINIPGGIGGCEVLSRLKELDPQVNAFIASGNPFDPLIESPTTFGFTGALAKPFSVETLRILLLPK